MTDDEAEDWLGAAVSAVGGIQLGRLDQACLVARRTCTHHSQVVPTIFTEVDAVAARESRIAEFCAPLPALPAPRQLDDAAFEQIVAERGRALSVAIDRGLIVSNGDGTFRLPDRAA